MFVSSQSQSSRRSALELHWQLLRSSTTLFLSWDRMLFVRWKCRLLICINFFFHYMSKTPSEALTYVIFYSYYGFLSMLRNTTFLAHQKQQFLSASAFHQWMIRKE